MAGTTTVLEIPYPEGGDSFAADAVQDLAERVDEAPGIESLTSAEIASLGAALKPAGRVVFNSTTSKLQVSNGTSFVDVDAAAKSYTDQAMPIGAIIAYGGTTPPTGWTVCDGRAHGSAQLQTLIGSANTPDLRDRFVAGAKATDVGAPAGGTYSRGNTGGAASVTLTAAQSGVPAHTHPSGATYEYPLGTGEYAWASSTSGDKAVAVIGVQVDTISANAPAGATTAHENRPPYYALVYIIKTV